MDGGRMVHPSMVLVSDIPISVKGYNLKSK